MPTTVGWQMRFVPIWRAEKSKKEGAAMTINSPKLNELYPAHIVVFGQR